MGQEPNIELEIADLPRPRSTTDPARSWRPQRPGELSVPGDVPWGGAFGTTGPDTGYALLLIGQRDFPETGGEHRHNLEAGIAALAGARASYFGRAPTGKDVDVALTILGLAPAGLPDALITDLARDRSVHLANLGHDPAKARALVAAVSIENLAAPLDDLRARMAAGERLIFW